MRYFGSKWTIAPWIIGALPPHEIYIEPFCGSASVLLRKARTRHEVIGDQDGDIVNLFRVVRDNGKALAAKIEMTPWASEELQLANQPARSKIERARRTLVAAAMGYGALGGSSGFRACPRGEGNNGVAFDWLSQAKVVEVVCARLKGVVIDNKPASELIQQYGDNPAALLYVDPPYLAETRSSSEAYRHEMSNSDHRDLLTQLINAKAMVVISGYESELYVKTLGQPTLAKQSRTLNHEARRECLWHLRCSPLQMQLL